MTIKRERDITKSSTEKNGNYQNIQNSDRVIWDLLRIGTLVLNIFRNRMIYPNTLFSNAINNENLRLWTTERAAISFTV